MDSIAEQNAAEGLPAGRSYGGPANAEPPTRVRSAAMREPVVQKPLTPEEKAELDRKAREIGILPPSDDVLDELSDDEDEPAPVPSPVPNESLIPKPGSIRNRAQRPRDVTATVIHPQSGQPVSKPMLPDFTKVQAFDLVSGTIYIDGMAFPIPSEDQVAMKAYAVGIALDSVVAQLAMALIAFGVPESVANEAADKLRATAVTEERTDGEGERGTEAGEAVQEVRID